MHHALLRRTWGHGFSSSTNGNRRMPFRNAFANTALRPRPPPAPRPQKTELEPYLADVPLVTLVAAKPSVRDNAFAAEDALREKPRLLGVVQVVEHLAKSR